MKIKKHAIFFGATGQNVGKTTVCLGSIGSLQKIFSRVGFIKPVGQQHVKVDDERLVDKDVVLFKKRFNLESPWEDMSPVLIPAGFTRDFLDKKYSEEEMLNSIKQSYLKIAEDSEFVIVEGTGHIGVGSIINLNNAKVAGSLGLDMVIISSGGLGSAFDELSLNIALCEKYGVKVKGIILNKVLEDKREMIEEYFPKALKKWGIPLLGCIPYHPFLNTPCMKDFENLFKTPLLAGRSYQYRHFCNVRLVAGSVDSYAHEIKLNELVITPASREDIVLTYLKKERDLREEGKDLEGGLILTGERPPSDALLHCIEKSDVPSLYAPRCSYDAMKIITSHIAKIGIEDTQKVEKAIQVVESNINFNQLAY